MKSVFLRAGWYKLVMANYEVDPAILLPYLPHKTELDFWEGKCYVSLVGFKFCDTKVLGIKIPFHINFEEVNLRFYVRCKDGDIWKRGVVFIKEIVPRHAISWIANLLYKEPYITMPMSHHWIEKEMYNEIEYRWRFQKQWNSIQVKTEKVAEKLEVGSKEEFITEHFWGYTRRSDFVTSEYQVEHPRWNMYKVIDYDIQVDFEHLYGKQFKEVMKNPQSVFMADGSEIIVRNGRKL